MTSPEDRTSSDRADLIPLARNLLGERPDADDVAQDVWLLLQRQPPGRVRSLGSWLRIAIRHLAARARLRDSMRAERERIVARGERVPSVLEQLEPQAQHELLTKLVNQLSEPYRQVLRLRYLEQLEVDEIAARVGRSSATVRSRLRRGLDLLRARMREQPDRRSRLLLFIPWRRGRVVERSDRWRVKRFGTWATLASGIAVGMLVLGFFLVRESGDGQVVAAAPSIRESPLTSLLEPAPVHGDGRSALVSEAPRPGRPAAPELASWGIDVEGFVLEPGGKTVPDAEVLVGNEDASEVRIAARSDSFGHYRILGVDRRLFVWAEDGEQISSSRHLLGSKPPERGLDLQLGPALEVLIGRVLTHQGSPVPQAEVVLYATVKKLEMSDQGTLALRPPPVRAWTDSDGYFRLGQPTHQNFRLLVLAAGHPPLLTTRRRSSEATQRIELDLPSPCALEGQLVRSDGTPAIGVRLELVFPEPLPRRDAVTDEHGNFCLEALAPGPAVVRLVADPSGASESCYVEVQLAEGERLRQIVGLSQEHTIRGRALDGDQALADWIVELEEQRADPGALPIPGQVQRTVTGADGSFSFPSCRPSGMHVLRLFEPNASSMPRALARDVHTGEAETLLRVLPGALSPGSLRARLDSRLPGLQPTLAALRSDSLSPLLLPVDPATGVVSAEDLLPGRYELMAWIPRFEAWSAGAIEIVPEQRTELVAEVPEPGSLHLLVDLPEAASPEELTAVLVVPAFDGSSSWTYQRLEKLPEQPFFAAELLPGEYRYWLASPNVTYETRRVHVGSGLTTEERVSFGECEPVTLHLSLARALQGAERISLIVGTPGSKRTIALVPSRTALSEEFSVLLPRDSEELLFETNFGLIGRFALGERDVVAGGEYHVNLVEPAR